MEVFDEMGFFDVKLYKAALGNCYESEDWGPVEFCIMAKHFERQGKSPYVYHSVSFFNMYLLNGLNFA